jgi:hypothetical protein
MEKVLRFLFGASLAFEFNLLAQPQISQQPQSRTAVAGSKVSFFVEASGLPPVQYQWQFNGQDIPGARSRALAFAAVPSRAGSYAVRVRDAAGEVRSSSARLDVVLRPAFVVQPKNSVVGERKTATLTSVLNESGPFRRIIWHNNNPLEGPHEIPPSTGLDTDDPTLVMPDCINDAYYNSIYWVAVTNGAAGITSKKIRLTVVGPPTFRLQPKPRTVTVGATVVFTAKAKRDKGPPATYQWYKDGRPIPGATTTALVVPGVQTGSFGNYYCIATGIGGSTTSWGAQLTVITPAAR